MQDARGEWAEVSYTLFKSYGQGAYTHTAIMAKSMTSFTALRNPAFFLNFICSLGALTCDRASALFVCLILSTIQ